MYQIIKKTKKLLGSPNSGAVKSLVQEVLKEITKEKNSFSFHNYIPIEKELNQTKEDLLNLSSAYDISSSISEEILNLRKKENHLTEVLKNQREQNTYIRKMISLIIPCFNEEESLPLFYPEATSVLRQMNCDYELIFVNDGSRDRTLEILKELT